LSAGRASLRVVATPTPGGLMSLRWYSVVVDCRDVADPEGNEFCVLSARAR